MFQDPRINGYPPAFHAVLKRDDLSRAEWQAFVGGFGVTAALVTYPDLNPRAALFAPAGWALIYRDAEALVFAARLPRWRDLIARYEQPLTFSYARDRGVTPEPLPDRPAASPLRDCEWQRRLGDALVALGERSADARAAYEKALATPGCLDDRARRRRRASAWATSRWRPATGPRPLPPTTAFATRGRARTAGWPCWRWAAPPTRPPI